MVKGRTGIDCKSITTKTVSWKLMRKNSEVIFRTVPWAASVFQAQKIMTLILVSQGNS